MIILNHYSPPIVVIYRTRKE